ncbi:hypothetical protein C8R44DRAFT_732881 [Mycena epipterygia]|nr:hypothetical protein C8R44DRAFT_732881 [Mycena epipterygia]
MPRVSQTTSHQHRGTGGMFAPSQTVPGNAETEPEDNRDNMWESDTESDTEEDADYFEAWEAQPKPRTYDEREERRLEKQEKAAAKHRAAEMRSTHRGVYGVGGASKRTVQAKKKKLRDTFKSGSLRISEDEFKCQLAAIDATEVRSDSKPATKPALATSGSLPAPRTIANMFANQKRARAPSPDDGIEENFPLPGVSFKRLRMDPPELPTEEESLSDKLGDEEEEEEPVPEQVEEQAREEHGDEVVDSIVLADDVADWVETVLDDAAPRDPKELGPLAAASLKTARKQKDYRSEVLFASLVDFYRWMPRMGRLRAALRVAKYHGRGPAFQRVIAAQARFFEVNGALKPSHQGQRERSNGLLDDEGFYLGVQRWLRTLEVGTVNPKLLQRHINETLLPSLALKKKTVSIRHCQRWLWRLGYRRKRQQKGVYWDGHERKDVKRRRKEFLAELHAYEHLRATYAEPDMREVLPELLDDEIEHVEIVHDEASFHSNDYQNNQYWLKPGEQVLKKKGRGRLIMVSAFLCERYGLLALTPEMIVENEKMAIELRLAITDSTTVIYPDNKTSGDDYWNMKQMIEQLIIAILIARRMFPKAIIHWIFDNSSAHGSLAPDALTTTKMNVNPGGKVPEMRDTIIPDSNPHGHAGEAQKMTFDKNLPADHPYKEFEGLPKGMKVILAERGYTKDTNGKTLIGDCKACKLAKARKPHLEGASADEEREMYGENGNDTEEEDEERPILRFFFPRYETLQFF